MVSRQRGHPYSPETLQDLPDKLIRRTKAVEPPTSCVFVIGRLRDGAPSRILMSTLSGETSLSQYPHLAPY